MRSLKIAQLASFRGNIGDNANVVGTRLMLARHLRRPIEYTNLEYLEYEPDPRWGGRKFDDDFVATANAHDLLIIGGGGFFELAVDKSSTATPINVSNQMLARIRVPIVFHALGFDISAGVTPQRVVRFRKFLRYALSQERILISVRNDGSLANLAGTIDPDLAAAVHKVPDGGFFTELTPCEHIELPPGKTTLAVNLAGDSLGRRYREADRGDANFRLFLEQLAGVLNRWLADNENRHVVLVPHIPEDLYVLWRLLERVGPPRMRKRLTVAPYIHGPEAHDYIFDIYRRSHLVLGMRFHANVCPIALGVPTIGLITHPQIANLYRELDLPDLAIDARGPDFGSNLWTLMAGISARREDILSRYAALIEKMRTDVRRFHERIAALVDGSTAGQEQAA